MRVDLAIDYCKVSFKAYSYIYTGTCVLKFDKTYKTNKKKKSKKKTNKKRKSQRCETSFLKDLMQLFYI